MTLRNPFGVGKTSLRWKWLEDPLWTPADCLEIALKLKFANSARHACKLQIPHLHASLFKQLQHIRGQRELVFFLVLVVVLLGVGYCSSWCWLLFLVLVVVLIGVGCCSWC